MAITRSFFFINNQDLGKCILQVLLFILLATYIFRLISHPLFKKKRGHGILFGMQKNAKYPILEDKRWYPRRSLGVKKRDPQLREDSVKEELIAHRQGREGTFAPSRLHER
jgi:hypothetical protein